MDLIQYSQRRYNITDGKIMELRQLVLGGQKYSLISWNAKNM